MEPTTATAATTQLAGSFDIALIMAVSATFPALAIGFIGARSVEAMGRNPEAANKIQTAMVLAIAFTEAIAIYGLVVSLILKFV